MTVLKCWCGRWYGKADFIPDENIDVDCGYHDYEDLVREIERLKKENERLKDLIWS